MSEYPEHEKMEAIKDKTASVGAFLEWVRETGYELCVPSKYGDWLPIHRSIEELLADHFGINLKTLESEKRAMLKKINFSREKAE